MADAVLMHRHTRDLTCDLSAVEASGRWTPARKAILLELIRRREISAAEACAKYQISIAELESWIVRDTIHGRRGLAVTKIQAVGR